MGEYHAVLSPSGAHRWMVCPASAVLEANEPSVESAYALEGTIAHALAATCLEADLNAADFATIRLDGKSHSISRENAAYVQEYIDFVRSRAKEGYYLLVEQSLLIEALTKEKGARGTSDAVLVSDDGKEIIIIDLKFGLGVRVEAFDNLQLLMYAAAACHQFETLGSFEKVTMIVHQPRLDHVDEWTVSISRINAFWGEVKDAVERVEQARKSNSLEGYFYPDEKACKFCKAKYKCPALASLVAVETGADFDAVDQTLIEPPDLAKAMPACDLIELWIKGIRGKVEAELLSGKPVKGWKLVEGKRGNRDWKDDAKAETEMKAFGVAEADLYNTSLTTPAKLEKKLKKKSPEVWDKVQALITCKAGKISVAPDNDPRPALTLDPSSDFTAIGDNDE